MAYDEVLADRVRDVCGLPERKMFGALAWMVAGNMAVGVLGDDLLVRVPKAEHAALLGEPGAKPFVMAGRPSGGWVVVAGEVLDDDVLREWVDRGVAYAGTLPPK